MRKQYNLALPLSEEPFFRGMNADLVARIEAVVYHREYEPRQVIYFPEDECDYVYWVRQGRVKVTRVSGDGRELTFRHLFAGDIFGEEILTPRARREDYAEALAPTILCLMRSDDFQRIAGEELELALAVARRLSMRAREVEQVLVDTVFRTVRSRVAAGLLRLYRRECGTGGDTLRITHQEVANLVGSTRETTTAVLHGMRKEGILEIANRRLTVLDLVALENLADSL